MAGWKPQRFIETVVSGARKTGDSPSTLPDVSEVAVHDVTDAA
jgi:hypothetical protein